MQLQMSLLDHLHHTQDFSYSNKLDSMRKKKVKINPGDIIQIPFEDDYVYARVLNYGDFAYYDYRCKEELKDFNELLESPILLKGITNERGLMEGVWKVIGNVTLENSLQNSVYYLTDVVDPNSFRIVENREIRPAKREECIGLPIGCIWDPIHIEQRFKDHYEGNENIALKMLDTLGNYKLNSSLK